MVRVEGGAYRLRATVAYDGTDFAGFQRQSRRATAADRSRADRSRADRRTVQGVLEAALEQITREAVRLTGAGRTDAGVHARGQVVAFVTHWRRSLSELLRAWNAVLPDDAAVLALCLAPEDFHPRFDAVSRSYRYTIWNSPVRDPLSRRSALWAPQELDLALMGEALALLVGEHDFATFGSAPGHPGARSGRGLGGAFGPRSTVRRVLRATCARAGDLCGADGVLYLDIEANAFLYRMVRSIVGTTLQVGRGQIGLDEFATLFAAADRSQAGPTAPPQGLCLVAVNY